ncbi:MAG TPA: transcription-repair coupling factor, partial [Azospira sp.]|nr:transcription-repair coupling factor [Azospira sp.]
MPPPIPHDPTALLALPPLPAAGRQLTLPPLAGSADALALARLAAGSAPRRLLVVLTASPADAQRLLEEIPWFAPELRVRLLPDWETLPYDSFSPHHDLVSERLATLYAVTRGECDLLLLPASTALYRFAPPSYLAAYTFFLKKGDALDTDRLKAQMTLAGYAHVTQVVSPGEYSVRGGLIDLFPMGAPLPYRLDLFDDEIESIKTFDVDSQRTLYPVPEIRLLPAREFPLDDAGRSRFRQRFREVFEGDPAKSGIYKDVSNGVPSAGIEYWLPLFFEETATLFDYLPADAALCLHRDVPEAIRAFWRDTQSRHRMLDGDRTRPLLPPAELFLSEEQFFVAAKPHSRVDLAAGDDAATTAAALARPLPPVAVDRRADDPLRALKSFVAGHPGRVFLLAESAGRRETLAEMLAEHGLKPEPVADPAAFLAAGPRLGLGVAPLFAGFVLDGASGIAFVTEAELFAGSPSARARR